MSNSLPEFGEPPLIEVALSVQFEKLEAVRIPQLGLVWQAFHSRFPRTEEQPPLEPSFEQFGPRAGGQPEVRLELLSRPPAPRLWFLNEEGTELVQVQRDRFVRNWRKKDESDKYPGYHRLREAFRQDFYALCQLVSERGWGSIELNQCEVTYVNLVTVGAEWSVHGELEKVITLFSSRYSDSDLGVPEEAAVDVKYVLNDDVDRPVGRLHVHAMPVLRASDNVPAIRLALTARGLPEGGGVDGALRFFDRGREAIVRCFTSITTEAMHKNWKRMS
ncbi:MAG: TIGR04255 family protein [Planctomycetes bacterium]|nr:TIGR04255 family protein [Planctomycetota bacterium]